MLFDTGIAVDKQLGLIIVSEVVICNLKIRSEETRPYVSADLYNEISVRREIFPKENMQYCSN